MPAYDVALFTTMPAADGSGYVEVWGAGYARQIANFSELEGVWANIAKVDFGRAGAAWGTVGGFGLFSGVVLMLFGRLISDRAVQVGYLYRFGAREIVIPTGLLFDSGLFDGSLFDDAGLGGPPEAPPALPPPLFGATGFDAALFGGITAPATEIPAAMLVEIGIPPETTALRVMDWSRRP